MKCVVIDVSRLRGIPNSGMSRCDILTLNKRNKHNFSRWICRKGSIYTDNTLFTWVHSFYVKSLLILRLDASELGIQGYIYTYYANWWNTAFYQWDIIHITHCISLTVCRTTFLLLSPFPIHQLAPCHLIFTVYLASMTLFTCIIVFVMKQIESEIQLTMSRILSLQIVTINPINVFMYFSSIQL